MSKKIIILSGLPGSGKSTYANNMLEVWPGVAIASADAHFMVGGEYIFDVSELAEAHRRCKLRYEALVCDPQVQRVIVDNTNLTAAEVGYFYDYASIRGLGVEIVRVGCDPMEAYARQKHNVPSAIFSKMIGLWETAQWPEWWVMNTVNLTGIEST